MFRMIVTFAAALTLFAPAVIAAEPAYTVSIAPDAATYTSLDVANGAASVTVGVVDAEGAPVADARVVAQIIRDPWVSNVNRELTFTGTTGEDGTFTFVVPAEAALPGTYVLRASYEDATGTGALVVSAV